MASPYKITYNGKEYVLGVVSGNKIMYDLRNMVRYLEVRGKYIYGRRFRIYRKDLHIIHKLLLYAVRDEENSKRYMLDLNKGILLSGPVGCGKTALMNLIRVFFSGKYRYEIRSTRLISFEFVKDGHPVIARYSNKRPYCFDDLGLEQNIKRYGNDCNVMGEILLSRYDLFTSHKVITHATTNLNAKELEDQYGNRVRSRMKEMFNLISFDKDIGDKRGV